MELELCTHTETASVTEFSLQPLLGSQGQRHGHLDFESSLLPWGRLLHTSFQKQTLGCRSCWLLQEPVEASNGDCAWNLLKAPSSGQDNPSETEKESLRGFLEKRRAEDRQDDAHIGGNYKKGERATLPKLEETISRSEKKFRARGTAVETCSPTEHETREDEKFMSEALLEAEKAASVGEVPVGAVIVQQGRIIARAYNRVEAEGDPTAHAEMMCIRHAAKANRDWRLTDATIYVTMEPCPMCAGALLQARVKRVVWGARNHLLGADGSWVRLFPASEPDMNVGRGAQQVQQHPFHKTVEVQRGILADDCSAIMRSFFRSRRKGEAPVATRKPWWLTFELWILLRKVLR
ncbi:hypothetical protein R1flu_012991 [Riccia fluitans]|uniref:tRNA(adenine(34)) deaminase n=1 Tax=Riccia fluitans TaxID=41844 RepID=A0ABD1ZC69_9MARC